MGVGTEFSLSRFLPFTFSMYGENGIGFPVCRGVNHGNLNFLLAREHCNSSSPPLVDIVHFSSLHITISLTILKCAY